jgi:hypothetical protein
MQIPIVVLAGVWRRRPKSPSRLRTTLGAQKSRTRTTAAQKRRLFPRNSLIWPMAPRLH